MMTFTILLISIKYEGISHEDSNTSFLAYAILTFVLFLHLFTDIRLHVKVVVS
jgi:hypothetical protein